MVNFSHIEEELTENGVLLFERNAGLNINDTYLSLPFAITDIEAKELGEYLNAFTQQKMYIRTLCGRVEALIDSIKRDYTTTAEKYYLEFQGQRITETAKDKLIQAKEDIKPHVETCVLLSHKKSQASSPSL